MKKFFSILIFAITMLNLIGCSNGEDNIRASIEENNIYKCPELSNIEQVTLNIEGVKQELNLPIYIEKNRYFIPMSELVEKNLGTVEVNNDNIKINYLNSQVSLDMNNGTWKSGERKEKLKKIPIIKDDNVYISLIDFTNMFSMKTRWYGNDKIVKIYKDKDMKDIKAYSRPGKQKGAIRFEDIYVTGNPIDSKYLEVLRLMGKYLGIKGVSYHASWVPRVVKPKDNIDLDPSKENSFLLAELIYTLDYIQYNKGVIGLHGYTHQRNDEPTGIGFEFGENYPSVYELTDRVEKAIKVANDLEIQVDFFEAPHYNITKDQNMALEDYFVHIFNNYEFSNNLYAQTTPVKSHKGKGIFVPTPLSYVRENGVNNMELSVDTLDKKTFAGMYFHPFLEVQIVELLEDNDGYPNYKYKEPSVLASVIDAFEKKRINIISITEIK